MAKMSKNSNSSFSSVKGISKSAGSSIAKIAKEATEDLVIKNDDKETENINVETEELEDLTEEEYLDELKEQKKDYEEPLEEIEKEIAALESLSMDYREWRAKYKDKYDLDELREIAKEKRDTYKDDIKEYKEDLKNDKATLESAIYKIEQLEKTAKYDQLSTEEEYKDYEKSDSKESLEEIKKIDLDKLFNKQYEGNLESYCRLNDIDYEKINELEFAEYVKKHDKLAYTSYFKGEELDYLIELDDEELTKKYNYLFETKGKDAADDYLTAMKDTIHQKVGSKRAQEYLNGLEKDEDGNYDNKAIANYLDTMLKGGGSGLNSFFEGLEAWGEKDHVYTANEYESMYILSALQENESFTNFLDNTYELSSSVGNMLPSVLLGIVTTPIVGTAVMGASSGGNNYHQMKVEGESTKDAITYGVLSGLSDAAIQHYLGAIPGLNDVSVTSLKTFGKSVAKEGLEEGVQEFFDATLQADIKDEDLNIKDTIKNSLKGAIYGALTAGIFNGASFATNKISKAGSIETDVKSDTKIEREVSEENGFQLNIDDIKGFYKAKLDQGFFTKDQVDNIISSINSKGYISEDTGEHLLDLFDGDYDVYIKTIHSSDLDSINEKGIYCNGTSTSIGGGVPQSINDINIDNTITGVDNIIDILRVIKNSNGFSQGLNPTDGTLIIKVPKGTDIKNYIYYNENENAFCISPECLDSFVKVDSDGIEQDVKDISGEYITEKLGDEITEQLSGIEVTSKLKNNISSINKKFTNQKDIAQFFNDPKQFLVNELVNLAIENSNNENLVAQINSDIRNYTVSELNLDYLYNKYNNYLSRKDKKILKDLIKKDKIVDNLTNTEKELIEAYTKHIGPLITAYQRQTITRFGNVEVFGNDRIGIENEILHAFETMGKDDNVKKQYSDVNEFIKAMDNIIEKSEPLKEDITVYRGVDGLYLNGNHLNTFNVGQKFNDQAFFSTSLLPTSFTENRDVVMEIDIPKGTKAAYLEKYAGIKKYKQQELLLDSNSMFEITSPVTYDPNTGQKKIKARLVPSTSSVTELNLDTLNSYNQSLNYYNTFVGNSLNAQIDVYDMMKTLKDNNLLSRYEREVRYLRNNNIYYYDIPEHNVDHVERVLLYSMYMGQKLGLNNNQMDLLIEAAKFHDCGRKDLKTDVNHALISANQASNILGSKYKTRDLDIISAIIEYHESNDSSSELNRIFSKYYISDENKNTVYNMACILKDADALDRVRFPGNLNINYIRTGIAKSMIKSSYQIQEMRADKEIENNIRNNKYTKEQLNSIIYMKNKGVPLYLIDFYSKYGTKYCLDIINNIVNGGK